MPNYTPNLNLEKPTGTENIKRAIINSNMDIIDAAAADNEYQIPTIVGTQVRIVRQSNTKRLMFRLEDNLSGTITISLDAGATSLPLKDINGNAITALEKGFIEVVYDTTFFTLRPRGSSPEPAYIPPEDWIDIDDCAPGNINLLVADVMLATYAFTCTTVSGQYTINWGDGTTLSYDSGTIAQHTYIVGTGQPCSRGYTTFKIVISGQLLSFKVVPHNLATNNQEFAVLGCCVNSSTITDLSYAFFNSTSPTLIVSCRLLEFFNIIGMTAVTNPSYMFYNCYSLQSVDISGMTQATDTSYMFGNCRTLKSVDISAMTAVTTASFMFNNCYSLQSIDVSAMTAVTTANSMFANCSTLQSVDISGVVAITNANGMFGGCIYLQSADISGMTQAIDVSNVFSGCRALQSVDISNMTLVTNASYMFANCSTLQSVDVSAMTAVTTASNMFANCSTLQSVDVSNMTAVTTANSMFSGCYTLQSVDVNNMTLVTNTGYMLNSCYALQSVDISNMTLVTNASYMFSNCYALQFIVATNFSSSASSVTFENAFINCEQLKNINFPSAKVSKISAKGVSGKLDKLETIIFHPSSLFEGTSPQLDIQYNTLTAAQLDAIFTSLPAVTSKTVNITGCTGAAGCTRSIATAKGWTVTG